MTRADWIEILWSRAWWTYQPRSAGWVEVGYHAYNLFEGAAWWTFAALVLRRRARSGRSGVELAYALAFLTFGLTDFREAASLTSWLLWIKGANLVALARLRSIVIRRHYPDSRTY